MRASKTLLKTEAGVNLELYEKFASDGAVLERCYLITSQLRPEVDTFDDDQAAEAAFQEAVDTSLATPDRPGIF